MSQGPGSEAPLRPRLRVFLFLPWGEGIEPVDGFLRRIARADLRGRLADPNDERLMRMARLDIDWHGETARCFASLEHPGLDFLPPSVVGPTGLAAFLEHSGSRPSGESWCLAFTGQHPQRVGPSAGRLCAALRGRGVGVLYYAFDEASRTMPCFRDIAPHLAVLIHDEEPLFEGAEALLGKGCVVLHRSWVANVLPFATPFRQEPEGRIVFLGSELGLTPHRQRQIDFLRSRFGDCFVAISDHSLAVAERDSLGRFKVGFCPEGRKFATAAMSATHTDRPFWSGCLGLVPVAENSRAGDRLGELAGAGLIVRYPHSDLEGLALACASALAAGAPERRRIYEHFNRWETVGRVVADALARAILERPKCSWPP
jgi:hypothetical protein